MTSRKRLHFAAVRRSSQAVVLSVGVAVLSACASGGPDAPAAQTDGPVSAAPTSSMAAVSPPVGAPTTTPDPAGTAGSETAAGSTPTGSPSAGPTEVMDPDMATAGMGGMESPGSGDANPATPGSDGAGPPDQGTMGPATDGDGSMMGSGEAGDGTTGMDGTAPPAIDGNVCERWKAERADLSEAMWNGDVAACQAGDMSDEARQSALRLVNLYRAMAGLDPVEMSEEGNRLAQGCALLMRANGRISHSPSEAWECYTEEAAKTAASSSLSSAPAVASVDGYMVDPGNPTTLGHRRWILSNMLSGIGFGSAGNFSCQYQPASWRRTGGKPWAAWPPPGQVPLDAFGGRFYTIDRTGWSVQSDSIDLRNATVTVTSDGADLAVNVTVLNRGYGSTYALGFIPQGWTAEAGKTYRVEVGGTSMPIQYDVEVVDCP
ncbi:MAG: CAP domain-containing protein [Myxococcales bacterium]|nr:CAP domain-containing protein [Myxococcales bacterium]MDD9971064.1 CAP domain-containing protein [Myxococcales bacterium]